MLQPPQPKREPEHDGTRLAVRAATFAVVAAVLFGVLLFRLWALQVLRSDHYVAQATQNEVRTIDIPPQRGQIVDSSGRVLVDNVSTTLIQVDPSTISSTLDCSTLGASAAHCESLLSSMPVGAVPRCSQLARQSRCQELADLAPILKRTPHALWKAYEQPLLNGPGHARYVINAGPPVTLGSVTNAQLAYVLERRDHFPGVRFLRTYKRSYSSFPGMGAILGRVSTIQAEDLKDPNFKGLPYDSSVGHGGVEYTYDRLLRGQPGQLDQSFDAGGHAVGQPVFVAQPQMGGTLQLTIDARLQQAAEKAIYDGINVAHHDGETSAAKGALVAMNPKTGAILAMASVPTYSPRVYNSQAQVKQALRSGAFVDQSFQGLFAPGSTFKPFTAAAAWWEGLIGPGSNRLCSPTFSDPGDPLTVFHNWDPAYSADVDLPRALEISCDTFFYRLGDEFYRRYGNSTSDHFPILLRRFGFGTPSPIDLGRTYMPSGLVPDKQWRLETYSNPIDQDWQPGYDITMAIGQSDLQITPLQLATAYSSLANGGSLVTPHVGSDITDPVTHRVLERIQPRPQRNLHLSPTFVDEIRQGLYQATHASDGTSTSVFGTFQPAVAGKTGTADKINQDPYAWWAGWAPYNDPKIVVVALIENGGHGGVSAAPAAREVLQAYFHPNERVTTVKGTDQSH